MVGQVLRVALRQVAVLAVAGLLLLALYVSLGRQLVPWFAEFRPELESRAAELLRQPVRIGRLEGAWRGLSPHLVIHDLRLGDPAGGLRIERVALVLDVFESLWARQLRLLSVEIEAPHLGLSQQADGQWAVEGWPLHADRPPPDVERLLAVLQQLPRASVANGQLRLQPFGETAHTLSYLDLALENRGRQMRLSGQALLPDGQPLSLRLDARVDPARWRQAPLDGYLALPQSEWQSWLPAALRARLEVSRLDAGGELWVRWRDQALARAVLRLHATDLALAVPGGTPLPLRDLGFTAYLDREPEGYRLLVDNLAFSRGEQRWGEARLQLARRADGEGQRWTLASPRLDIGPLVPLVEALAPLPEPARALLGDLAPHGVLHNLTLNYTPDAAPANRLRYAANLEGAGFSDSHWIPAADNVSGSIAGDLAGGELRLDAQDASLHLARLFPAPWRYRQVRGRLTWTIDEAGVVLRLPYVEALGDEGRVTGDFAIHLLKDPALEDYMDLRVGLRDGDAALAERYLPTLSPAMSPALADWLKSAIRGGRVEQGYFVYQGALSAAAPPVARHLQLFFAVDDGELAYRPGWPALREARGEVRVEGAVTRVDLEQGRILDAQVRDGHARVARAAPDQPVRLDLQGQVSGTLGDALSLLREVPLGLADTLDGWQAEGPLEASLTLGIPFQAGARPDVRVAFSTEGARFQLARPALTLEALGGDFRYDHARGLSASRLAGRFLGQPFQGRAVASGAPGRFATRVEARGEMPVETLLRWLDAPAALPVDGRFPYQLRLDIDGAASRLQVDSSLVGARLALPEPFGKAAEARRDASLVMSLAGAQRQYQAHYGDLAALIFAAPPGEWRGGRGELRLGGGVPRLPREPGVQVRGSVPRLVLADWQALLADGGDGGESAGRGGALLDLLRDVQLRVARFEGLGASIDNLGLRLARQGKGWRLDVDSATVAGRIVQAPGVPLDIRLAHLRLPAPAPGDGEAAPAADPLEGFDPSHLPAADVAIDALWRGEERLGSGSGRVRPGEGAARFTDLALSLRGLALGGEMIWSAGQTRYRGRIQGDDIADVLAAWGFARSATSERFRLDVDGHWPGSPPYFSFKRFSGRLDASLRNGQFVEVEGGAQALRVFGLLNFNAIGRRLRLDFSDLLGRGLSYDRVRGDLQAEAGVYATRGPLALTGPSSNLELNGTLDLVADRIDAKLLVTLPVTNNLPLAAIIAGAPAIGGALWVADKLLGDRMARFATVQYDVSGPWQSPEIRFDKPFEKPN